MVEQTIIDSVDIILNDIATEFGLDLDDVFATYEGILADPETKNLGLTKIQTNEYALHMLRCECMQR